MPDVLIEALVTRFKEAATTLSHSDIRSQLSNACPNGSICDVFGDDDSGDVVYHDYRDGKTKRAPYEISASKNGATVDHDSAKEVVPKTVYQNPPDEDGEMTESAPLGLHERFISKGARDAADTSDFAGNYEGSPNKKSFPILKSGDVMAAVHSIGRGVAGGHDGGKLKQRIKSIAKRKGFALPDSMQPDASKESADIAIAGEFIKLREGAVGQDGSAYLKLIAPGWGSSGYYGKEMLKRDGPQVFKAGLKNYWNHQTAAEESARPEGDLRDVASILTEDAHWEENGPAGSGLYARAEVQPHYRASVDSLAKHIGVSIRAHGSAKEGAAEGRKGPIIEKLTRAQSVDYVTEPGAGGKVLQLFEAARAAHPTTQGDDMDEAQVNRLIERAVSPLKAENAKLRERLAMSDEIPKVLKECFAAVRIDPVTADRISRRVVERATFKADGSLDAEALKKIAEAEIKDEGEYLSRISGGRVVIGMGQAPSSTDPAKVKEAETQLEEAFDEEMKELSLVMVGGGDSNKAKRKALREGRAA